VHVSTKRPGETDGKRHDTVLRKSCSKPFHEFRRTLFREDPFILRVLYTVTFGAPSSTCLHKLALRGLTERSGEPKRNRDHIVVRKSCSKRFRYFERTLFHKDPSGLRGLYTVTFATTSSTCLLKLASHGLTGRLGETERKRGHLTYQNTDALASHVSVPHIYMLLWLPEPPVIKRHLPSIQNIPFALTLHTALMPIRHSASPQLSPPLTGQNHCTLWPATKGFKMPLSANHDPSSFNLEPPVITATCH